MSTFGETLELVERTNHRAVVDETWGHLRPEPGTYNGFVVFASGEYGDTLVVKSQFDGILDSPWFFDDLQNFVTDVCEQRKIGVYKFVGTYKKLKNGKSRFSGKIGSVAI